MKWVSEVSEKEIDASREKRLSARRHLFHNPHLTHPSKWKQKSVLFQNFKSKWKLRELFKINCQSIKTKYQLQEFQHRLLDSIWRNEQLLEIYPQDHPIICSLDSEQIVDVFLPLDVKFFELLWKILETLNWKNIVLPTLLPSHLKTSFSQRFDKLKNSFTRSWIEIFDQLFIFSGHFLRFPVNFLASQRLVSRNHWQAK